VNAFSQLSESNLLALIEAIEKQQFMSGNRLLLARHLPSTEIETVAAEIDRLIDDGLSQSHLSYLLRMLLSERQHARAKVPKVELVWTGPEGSGAATEVRGA
jgi:hypothetical protein